MPETEELRFYIVGRDLYYTVPAYVANPPVFDISEGSLRVLTRGFFPPETVFGIMPNGQLTVDYDLSAFSDAEKWVIDEVHSLMGLADNELLYDGYIFHFTKSIERFILNYCALRKVPEELFYVWAEMVAAKTQSNKNGFGSVDNSQVKSLKDGSQSVTYADATDPHVSGLSKEEREEFLNGWGHQLRQFRRVKWG